MEHSHQMLGTATSQTDLLLLDMPQREQSRKSLYLE
nr:MAG TPA: hypothetical protein [Caudoviricetes sp.]DAR50401.1 MAG TPA: hypothetical protein [Caudoviricetes sp.]